MQQGTSINDRYRIGALIGQGGMGAVYRGQDLQTGQTVAIKRLKPELVSADSDLLERFSREGQALRELNHPNIVKILDALQDASGHYLVMEYVGGGSLADLLAATPQMPVPRVLDITLELADALTRAHHLKIIHRDIKPANVLLADDGTARLSDFGVALMSAGKRLTGSGVLIGTPEYLSPEMLNGQAIDPRSDLWAFGVLLFEMLTGQRPFTAPTIGAIVSAILHKPTPDLEALRPDIPVALADLVYRMLERDRNQRIPSARLVGAELEALIQGRDTPSKRQPAERPHFETPPDALRPRHNLPLQTTAFVGREQELAELAKLLDNRNVRLVTILAPGGMGKTRLALETVERMLDAFTNGVYFVALAPVTSPDFIVSAIADGVGFQFYQSGEPKQQLLDYFRQKHMLLVLDNFEHLLDGAAIVSGILAYAPGVKVLATSRERLNLSGETIFALSGMDFPDWETPEDALEYAAVKLFMQSTRRVRPDFELSGDDLTYLARICRLVAGMPLGIVLAAAWVEMLSLEEIASEIAQSLDFLETELRDVPERQRSLRAIFEYSWNRLSDGERDAFMKLSVFRGGFTREAALAVAGASLKTLTGLVNKALLRRDPGSGRYEIHELLRQYAEQQLKAAGELGSSQDTHSIYYAQWMHKLWDDLKGRRQVGALKDIDAELDNARTCWNYLTEKRRAKELGQIASTLWFYWDMRDKYHEAYELFGRAVQALRSAPAGEETEIALGHILARRGWSYTSKGFPDQARAVIEEGLAILQQFDCPEETMMAFESLALATLFLGDLPRVKQESQRCLKIAREVGTQWGIAHALYWLSSAFLYSGEIVEARKIGEEGLKCAEEIGDLSMTGCISAFVQGKIAEALNDYPEARKRYQRGLRLFQELGQSWGIATAHENLGCVARLLKEYADARFHYRQSLKSRSDRDAAWETLPTLLDIAKVFAAEGTPEMAVELLALILQHPASHDDVKGNANALLSQLKAEAGGNAFAAAWERGQARDLDATVHELLATL